MSETVGERRRSKRDERDERSDSLDVAVAEVVEATLPSQCCQVSVFYRNFTDLSWLSSRTTPLGYKLTERGTPSQPCITSPFKQQTISQSCSHHFLLKYDQ